jgi:hypothetical protein
VIQHGLHKDDRVLIGALQQVRPRMTIEPELMSMPTANTPAAPQDKKPGKAKKKGK